MAVGAPFQKSKRPFSGGDDLIDEAADHIIVGLNLRGAGDAIFSGGHGLSHRVVDRAAVMPRINVVVKIADPIRPRLKIVNLHVVIGEQHLDQRLLLVQIELQRAVFVGLIPREKRIRREKEHELRIAVLLDVRQEVVLHVHLELIGKRRLFPGVALLDAAGAERIPRKHGVLAICEQVAPHVHGVYLIRIALAERHQALGDVFGQHAGVEPIGDVVKQVVVVEVIRRFMVGRFIEVGQRVQINAVQHAANVVRGKGQLHHLFVIEGEISVADEHLAKRDGIGIWDTKSFSIRATKGTKLLVMEVPM